MVGARKATRRSRKQRIALAALYYLRRLSGDGAVWSHDLHRWLVQADPATALTQSSVLAILNRLEEQGLVVALWEQFDGVVAHRPSRKYHRLTKTGEDEAVQALQALRADRSKPGWVLIPEETGGQFEPSLEGFRLEPPQGRLVIPSPALSDLPDAGHGHLRIAP